MIIQEGSKVTVKYSICRLNSAAVYDRVKSFKTYFIVGKQEVLPIIEKSVLGRRAGDSISLEVWGGDLFGSYDENKIIPIPFENLDTDKPLNPGDLFHFRDRENKIHPFRVERVEGNVVWADFNHPLGREKFLLNIIIEKVE